MIFIGGIHGVGKSYFCEKLKEVTGIVCYTSSNLIEQKKKLIIISGILYLFIVNTVEAGRRCINLVSHHSV